MRSKDNEHHQPRAKMFRRPVPGDATVGEDVTHPSRCSRADHRPWTSLAGLRVSFPFARRHEGGAAWLPRTVSGSAYAQSRRAAPDRKWMCAVVDELAQ